MTQGSTDSGRTCRPTDPCRAPADTTRALLMVAGLDSGQADRRHRRAPTVRWSTPVTVTPPGHDGGLAVRTEQAILGIASRSAGVVTRNELRAAGVSDTTISRRANAGSLRRIARGVFEIPALVTEETRYHRAAEALPRGALSHRSAALLRGSRSRLRAGRTGRRHGAACRRAAGRRGTTGLGGSSTSPTPAAARSSRPTGGVGTRPPRRWARIAGGIGWPPPTAGSSSGSRGTTSRTARRPRPPRSPP